LTKHLIELTVNGKRHTIETDANKTLLWILRHKLGLTGAKPACERGDCGLCTILLDDEPVKSCLVLAVEANAHKITTIEGITKEGALSTLQTKFIEHGALQCGFCTPAAVLVATALLKRNPSPTREQVVESVEGILCRCTGYRQIIDAILDASKINPH
jgi:aerobic-type carbon monoxide dehydrogenase small subunit (CoxS/CutS family)